MAVIFDLGRGGVFAHRPTAEFGALAYSAAMTAAAGVIDIRYTVRLLEARVSMMNCATIHRMKNSK